ncbi:MafI family immunity protein [Pseudomonas mosselii]|uniref:MafI family immunity protein n=2 Tax=Pseudomonas mosselii TaxID=78327 RepID=A0ABX9AVS7_9PSED|nr:MafI family immunity protein [Pseudomonas mosselii]QZP25158.1 MafI family immunity protein [Pseudomonas mosselii]
MYANRIVKFGERFQGRLDSTLLQGALDYVGYSEESLAFEILCDHVCEYDVSI